MVVSTVARWPKSAEIACSKRASLSSMTAPQPRAAGRSSSRSSARGRRARRRTGRGRRRRGRKGQGFSGTGPWHFPGFGVMAAEAGPFAELLARAAPFAADFGPILPVIKSKKARPRPFPKRIGVGTYRPHPLAFWRPGCLLRKPLGREHRRGRRVGSTRFDLRFLPRRAMAYRGVEQPGSSSGS